MALRSFVVGALAVGTGAQWSQEGGGSWRHNNVAYNRSAAPPGPRHAAVFEANLGTATLDGHIHTTATPVITRNGLVIVSDDSCRIYGFPLPETLPQPTAAVRQTWSPLWVYAGSQSVSTAPQPDCTSAVVTPGLHVLWVSKQKHALFGIDVSDRANPVPLLWSPLLLPPAHFRPGSFSTRLSLLLVNHTVWIPSHEHNPPGAMAVDVLNGGAYTWVEGTPTSSYASASGSCGGEVGTKTNPNGKSALFILDNATHAVEYWRSNGSQAWATSVNWNSGQRHEHPTFVDMQNNHHCMLAFRTTLGNNKGSVHAALISQSNGGACWEWPTGGKWLQNRFINNAHWISSPAVLPGETYSNQQPTLWVTSRLPNGQASLTSWIVADSTIVLRDGHRYDGQPYASPILLRNGRGTRHGHVVIFPGPAGSVQSFDAWSLAEGPYSTVHLRRWGDRDGLRILGPYMAATRGGTVLVMARGPAPAGSKYPYTLYMYGVTNAHFALPPDPAPAAAPSAAPVSAGAVVGSLFGVAAAAGLGFFLWGKRTNYGGYGSAGAWGTMASTTVASVAYKVPGVEWTVGAVSAGTSAVVSKVTGNRFASFGASSSGKAGGMTASFTSSAYSSSSTAASAAGADSTASVEGGGDATGYNAYRSGGGYGAIGN